MAGLNTLHLSIERMMCPELHPARYGPARDGSTRYGLALCTMGAAAAATFSINVVIA